LDRILRPGHKPNIVGAIDVPSPQCSISQLTAADEAQTKLKELIHQLAPGEEVVITENHRPVARLVSEALKPKTGLRPPPGLGKGFITVIADDDEHLKDFEELDPIPSHSRSP
jgi:antitoxin (DNA-binding transcriptional repressor) of toxin-antitoxin stability system